MKRLLTILFCFGYLAVNATTYYVSTTGDDSDPGTITEPWLTWQKAFDVADEGDTVYFRGGVYISTSSLIIDPSNTQYGVHGNNGTYSNPICYFNYPGEEPILSCEHHCDGYDGYNTAISILTAEHIKFKGLEIKNVYMCDSNKTSGAIAAIESANLTFENIVIHDVGQRGYWVYPGAWSIADGGGAPFAYDTTRWINCDVYNLCDTFVNNPGNAADGWKVHTYENNYYSWEGCRAWQYSDDGIDPSGQGKRIINNCWVIPTAKYEGVDPVDGIEANGIKLGGIGREYISGDTNTVFSTVTNCLAAFGDGIGFYDLDYEPNLNTNGHFYNNTAYKMGIGFSSSSAGQETAIWKNNISYGNKDSTSIGSIYMVWISAEDGPYLESHNTWDMTTAEYPYFIVTDSVTVTDDDFVVVDSLTAIAQLTADRQPDGSLPDISFLTLKAGSDLIDAGVDVGLPYNGSAPDLGYSEFDQIIADHTVVDKYDDIPQQWIDSIKSKWLVYAGESHSAGIRNGLAALELLDPTYAVSVILEGTPEPYTTENLRVSRATWGDVSNATGWIYTYGEEDWYTSETAIARTKAGISYCNSNDLTIGYFGFGHCYGDGGGDYVEATQEYIDYCSDSIDTKVFYTTGPVDGPVGIGDESSYLNYLVYQAVRDSVKNDPSRVLFDYSDILYYDNDGSQNIVTWDGHTFPVGTTLNTGANEGGHITSVGALRLAKAMWWMLARMEGWDGSIQAEIDSTANSILTFTIPSQTGAATINSSTHAITIEVAHTANITSLTPTITVSEGATISPTSGTATNFANPVTYTVTALDESTQEWVVTVTVASEPNSAPIVTNIPNQTITTGSSFATINLDNYVSDADNTDSQITWTYSGDTHINISITNRVATITYDNGFTGSETITFTATDPDDLSDSDQAVFVINAASTPSGTCLLRINYAGSKKIRQGSERRIGIN